MFGVKPSELFMHVQLHYLTIMFCMIMMSTVGNVCKAAKNQLNPQIQTLTYVYVIVACNGARTASI